MVTQYKSYGVNLSKSQISKINNAAAKGCSTSIRLTKKNFGGDHKLPLTQTQVKRLENAKTGVDIELSVAQLKAIKMGGFLPLLTLIPLIAAGIGAAGAATGGISAAVSAAKSNAEQQRHNRAVEEQLSKSGTGVVSDTISKIPVLGPWLAPKLKKFGLGLGDINKLLHGGCICKNGCAMKMIGNGLYLEPQGSGLFLGPNEE